MTTTTTNAWLNYSHNTPKCGSKIAAVRISAVLSFEDGHQLGEYCSDLSAHDLLQEWRCSYGRKDEIDLSDTRVLEFKPWVELKRVTITMPIGGPYTSTEEDERTYRQVCDSDERTPTNSGFARWLLDQRCDIQIEYQKPGDINS